MSIRIFKSAVVLSVVAFLAIARGAATPTATPTSSQCDTGEVQCCQQVFSPSNGGLLGILGSVGLDCTPINVLGFGGGADCAQQPVCCTNVDENGILNLGCSPINLNL